MDVQPSHMVLAAAVAPDQGNGGSRVGQYLEPMSIILNLGMSRAFLTLLLAGFMVRRVLIRTFLFLANW